MNYEYLLFDLVILLLPVLGSLFGGKLPKLLPAAWSIGVIGIGFIVWDQLVSEWWWRFNPSYVLGFYIGKLPIEEVLFFIVVPWSCLVIWEQLLNKGTVEIRAIRRLLSVILIGLLILAWKIDAWYLLCVALLSVVSVWIMRETRFVAKKTLVYLAIVVGLILVFNMYLTARPVVIYNSEIIVNIRIGTIPLEDVLYGLNLVGLVTWFYERLLKRNVDDSVGT